MDQRQLLLSVAVFHINNGYVGHEHGAAGPDLVGPGAGKSLDLDLENAALLADGGDLTQGSEHVHVGRLRLFDHDVLLGSQPDERLLVGFPGRIKCVDTDVAADIDDDLLFRKDYHAPRTDDGVVNILIHVSIYTHLLSLLRRIDLLVSLCLLVFLLQGIKRLLHSDVFGKHVG